MNGLFSLLVLVVVAATVSSTSYIPHPRPCSRAPKGLNAVVSIKLSGNNGWAKYTCLPGFVRFAGLAQLDCVNGRYTSTNALRCRRRPRPCPKAPTGVNALVTVTRKGNNAWAKYTCKPGFVRFAGRAQLDCVNGRYTSTDALRCRRRVCPAAPAGVNVIRTLFPKGPTSNQVVRYRCLRGFRRVRGRSILRCRNGVFSSTDALRCVRVPVCPAAPKGSNASVRVSPKGPASNQVARYRCNSGFVRKSGSRVLKCRGGRYVSTDALRCVKRVVCPSPPKGQNVKVTVTGSGANQWAKYRCINRRFRVVGGRKQLDCKNGSYTSTDALRCAAIHPHPKY